MRTVTTFCRVVVGVVAVSSSLLMPHGVGAQSAEAATAVPAPAADVKPRAEGLFGNLSLTSDRGPLHISADQLEFDYRTSVLTYRGGVTVKQADLTLNSNVLRVTLDPKATDQLREVVAEGEVQIAKGERRASGGRAVFDQASRTIVLSDRATLRDGPNEVAGERVVVYLDEERSVIEGGTERVRAVLFPEPDGDHPGGDKGDEADAERGADTTLTLPVEREAQAGAAVEGGATPPHPDGE
jgi:lipopolysaccharide export system protein LptA